MNSVLEVRADDAAFRAVALSKPWAFRVASGDDAILYAARAGSAWIEVAGAPPEHLRRRGVISLPGGPTHTLRDSVGTIPPARAVSLPFERLESVDPDTSPESGVTILVVARVPAKTNPLPDILPATIHVPPEEAEVSTRLNGIMDTALLELGAPLDARAPILKRLGEVLAIELIEFSLKRPGGNFRLRAMDARVRRALQAMHTQPERHWTLTELAAEAGLSRSTFADRFREAVDDTPLNYLTAVRMQRAAGALRAGDSPIYEVASSVGYSTEAAFSKAFRRVMGASPTRYRRARSESG